MSGTGQKLPDDAPIIVAWRKWQDTAMFAMSAGHEPDQAMLGRIWIAFHAGWEATGTPVQPKK